jgi:hypothetical protein
VLRAHVANVTRLLDKTIDAHLDIRLMMLHQPIRLERFRTCPSMRMKEDSVSTVLAGRPTAQTVRSGDDRHPELVRRFCERYADARRTFCLPRLHDGGQPGFAARLPALASPDAVPLPAHALGRGESVPSRVRYRPWRTGNARKRSVQ